MFPFVEVALVILALLYLYVGWRMVVPMGWYFGEGSKRTWYKDIIFIIIFILAVLLWLPIILIVAIFGSSFKREL